MLFTFHLDTTYTMEGFTGREINNRTIGVCPLLAKEGPVDEQRFSLANLLDTLHRRRPEIRCKPLKNGSSGFFAAVSAEDRKTFFTMLFEGNMLSAGTFDTVWQATKCDYLLVCSIRHGMSVTTFNRVTKKMVLLEAELWDSRSFEVVWRTTVEGSCTRCTVPDSRLITSGIGEIVSALPVLLPSYDNSAW